MLHSQINTHFDFNLYDRQVRTYGIDAVQKMSLSSVLVIGLDGGLGIEVCKNLALGGIKNIYLFDDGLVCDTDLSTGYYYSKEDIGKSRAKILQPKLQELNPYVSILITNEYDKNQNVSILINQQTNFINKFSDRINSKLVVLYSKGISGVIFVDAGLSHVVNDKTGENIEPVQIAEISRDGHVKCAPYSTHDYQSGDYIELVNLEGLNVKQLQKEWKIKVINKTKFLLEDFNVDEFTFLNGTSIYIKKPVIISHKKWSNDLVIENISFTFDYDYTKNLIDTYLKMFSNNLIDKIDDIWSDETNKLFSNNSISLIDQARLFKYDIIPIISIMGSFGASEVIKLITNKYLPITQWFSWSDLSLIPKEIPKNYKLGKTNYSKIWGLDFERKLINSKWFIVGSGAIGCEHLKNLAYMGVGNMELDDETKGGIIITDPDSIEKSNLNRQFLFRSHHIGKSKSQVASEVIKEMKPFIKIRDQQQKVGTENLEYTNNILSLELTGVLNALDNIKARRFMDEQCFKFNIPLFESGTTGTKGNTQPIIPFITETYSNSSDPDQEKSYPICTIKSFPNEISHTIHWAMDQFEFFNRAPTTMNKWIYNINYLNELSHIEKNIAIEDINFYSFKYPTQKLGFKCCAIWAIDMFMENYYNSIIQLLHTFPPSKEVVPGVLFWSAGKRCPKPIKFDITNNLHMDYIEATTNLLAITSGLQEKITREELIELIKDYKPCEFTPKNMEIASNDSELEKIKIIDNTNLEIGNKSDFTNKYIPQEFEKDDDKNWHISWITAASNMRALNYGIPNIDYQQTKGIAGRIIPAISTTTSIVSGLILLEVIKYINGFDNIENYKSSFINLAEPILIYSEPISAPFIDVAGVKVNSWTKFEYHKDSTLGEFKLYYENIFKTNINIIIIGTSMAYADFIDDNVLSKKLSQVIFDILDEVPSNVSFILGVDDDSKNIPSINVKLDYTKQRKNIEV